MFVDTDQLRMGAAFSRSAGIFGDFEAAHGFHQALHTRCTATRWPATT
jgi:hypothetical protein